MKCLNHFGAKRRGFIKSEIVLAPKGASQNFIKNIRYDIFNDSRSIIKSKILALVSVTQ